MNFYGETMRWLWTVGEMGSCWNYRLHLLVVANSWKSEEFLGENVYKDGFKVFQDKSPWPYILKAMKSAEPAFQFQKICGKSG